MRGMCPLLQTAGCGYFGDDTPESVRRCYPRARHVQDGLATASFLTLGHRRLSILDLSPAGHQPMSYGNGRYSDTYLVTRLFEKQAGERRNTGN